MEELILKSWPTYPPVVRDTQNLRISPDFYNNPVPRYHTHGGALWNRAQGADDAENELICLLMRCLADVPADRPSLWELSQYVQFYLSSYRDDDFDNWYDDMFSNVPTVRYIPPGSPCGYAPVDVLTICLYVSRHRQYPAPALGQRLGSHRDKRMRLPRGGLPQRRLLFRSLLLSSLPHRLLSHRRLSHRRLSKNLHPGLGWPTHALEGGP